MSLKNFLVSRFHKENSKGTTFVEVLVAVSILSIVMLAIWSGFASSMSLAKKIPEVIDDTASLFIFEDTIRKEVARIKVPFWVYEYTPEEDSRSISFPYCDGIPYKVITFEYIDDQIEISTASNDEKNLIEPEEPKITLGPFSDAEFELVYEDDTGLVGVDLKVTSEKTNIGEISVYAKFESEPFWKL